MRITTSCNRQVDPVTTDTDNNEAAFFLKMLQKVGGFSATRHGAKRNKNEIKTAVL